MRSIEANGLILAVIGNKDDLPNGKYFYDKPELALQWGTMRLPKGEVLQPHIHKIRNRQFKTKTIEFFYVMRGALKAYFYDNDKNRVCIEVLREGDFVVMYDGGHGFKVLKEDTRFLEVKLGPHEGIEVDKLKWAFGENNNGSVDK